MAHDIEQISIDDLYECRICLEFTPINQLISPCLCNGTSKYVHIDCLQKWRRIATNPIAKKKCLECYSNYNLRKKNTFIKWEMLD